ncbi:porin family protein [Pseudooceanicola sp. CBS1P-1]|uniref:Outer membrane beta-barrel protein n=1 Tax=Pseudooceanicola albus TaxID=2692189 RepID=A0A6L7G1G1_9RHOB|nr:MULTISPECIES: outer membrane beta-barrel protein [Pseudooceanicola]MBT9382748.1 porin family protein [Pseudooceanicola endophyticus]MXN17286.1 outer membrane beta-barrel protein [Pseudooceanicola albus]
MLRNKLIAAAAVASTAAIAAPAFAGNPAPAPADPIITAPAPAPVVMGHDWTGGYAGLNLGYGKFKHSGDDGDGTIYGAQAGYDYDFGDYILGGEISYNAGDIDTFDGIDVDNTAALKVKAGYDMGDTMVYGTAGAERVYSNIGDDTGWVAGVGVEHMITPTISLGAEYLHHQVDDFAGTNAKLLGDSIAAKVNYRF